MRGQVMWLREKVDVVVAAALFLLDAVADVVSRARRPSRDGLRRQTLNDHTMRPSLAVRRFWCSEAALVCWMMCKRDGQV
jgi:hypothetical protein